MAGGGGRRDADAAVRIGTGNVFAALEALKRKKKKPPSSSSSSSSAASAPGRKGKGSTRKAAAPGEENAPPPEVFWAPAPLKSKSWADVEEDDDDDYFATTAPPRPVWGTAATAAAEGKPDGAEEVSARFASTSTYVTCTS
jgi:hypothetical protein